MSIPLRRSAADEDEVTREWKRMRTCPPAATPESAAATPGHAATTADWDQPVRWNNELEVQDWRAALDWLKGRCTFCAGRGLTDADIRHTLRQCKRGGAGHVHKGLGESIYDEGFLPENGCKLCCLPRQFCSDRYRETEQGGWVHGPGWAECSYDRHLLCDAVIGFASCGAGSYEEDLFDGIEGHYERTGEEMSCSFGEDAAAWLMQPVEVAVVEGAAVEGSEMMRQVSIWAHQLDGFSGDRART